MVGLVLHVLSNDAWSTLPAVDSTVYVRMGEQQVWSLMDNGCCTPPAAPGCRLIKRGRLRRTVCGPSRACCTLLAVGIGVNVRVKGGGESKE